MKKLMMMLIMILLVIGLFANGQQDNGPLILGVDKGDHEVMYDMEGNYLGKESGVWWWKDIVLKDYPEEVIVRGYSADNSTIKIDVDIAGGDPPDVYFDYIGRTNKYANSKFAVPIDLGDEADAFIPSYLDLLTKDGTLYGLPETAWSAVMIVNKPLLEEAGAGYLLPADNDPNRSWTVDAFIKATKMVQKHFGEGYYGYVLFASTTGGDYWSSFGWLAGHGAKLYENGQIVLDRPEGIRALKFMKNMQDSGIAMKGAAGLSYAENLNAIMNNNVVAMGGTPDHALKPTELADGSGSVQCVIMEYPHIEGIDSVPISVGPDAGMIFKTGNKDREARSLALLKYITSEKFQTYQAVYRDRFASLKGIPKEGNESPTWILANEMIAKNGIFDMGTGLEKYAEVRELYPPVLQAIFSGELSVEDAVARFAKEGGEILE